MNESDEEEKVDNVQLAVKVRNDQRNSEDRIEEPQLLETGDDNDCLVSLDDSDEFASDNLMESLKMADQYSKLQSDYTRLKNKHYKLVDDSRLSSVRLEEMYNKMRSCEDQKRKFESDLKLLKSENARLEQENGDLIKQNRCTKSYQERSRIVYLKYQNCATKLVEFKKKFEESQEKQNQLMGMVKDMLSSSSEASKKEIHWKDKLDECKNENKMMKKHWNEVLRVIADISRQCCDILPPTISQRVNRLPLDELLQIGKSEGAGDSDDEAANEVHRLLNVDISMDTTRKSRGRGPGTRGRSKSMGRVVDERMHEDLIARKLHRNDDDQSLAASSDPIAKSVMGRKTETVREQQERQKAGFKDKVAQMKKEYKAKQGDDSHGVDALPSPSMDEEDRLMICEDEEQSDGGVDHFNSLDNKDMTETPLFDRDMSTFSIGDKHEGFEREDEPGGSMYDSVKRRRWKTPTEHKQDSQVAHRITNSPATPKRSSSMISSRRETIDFIPLGRGRGKSQQRKNDDEKIEKQKMVSKSFSSSNVVKLSKKEGRDADESSDMKEVALSSKEHYQMNGSFDDNSAPLDDVAAFPNTTPTRSHSFSNKMNCRLPQGVDKQGPRQGNSWKEEERRKTSQALFGDMSDSEDDDTIEDETKKEKGMIETKKDEEKIETEKKMEDETNVDDIINEKTEEMEQEIVMVEDTTLEEKNEGMEEETVEIEDKSIDEKEDEMEGEAFEIEDKKMDEVDKVEDGVDEENEEIEKKKEEMKELKKEEDGIMEEVLVINEDETMEEEKEEEEESGIKEENDDEIVIENAKKTDEMEMEDNSFFITMSDNKSVDRRESTTTSIETMKLPINSPIQSIKSMNDHNIPEEMDEESHEMEENPVENTDIMDLMMDDEAPALRRSSRSRKPPAFFSKELPSKTPKRNSGSFNKGKDNVPKTAMTRGRSMSREKSVVNATPRNSRAKSVAKTSTSTRAKSIPPPATVPKTRSKSVPPPKTVLKTRSKSIPPDNSVPKAAARSGSKSVAKTIPVTPLPNSPVMVEPKNEPISPIMVVPITSAKAVSKTPIKNVPRTVAKTPKSTPRSARSKSHAEMMGSEKQKCDLTLTKGIRGLLEEFADDEMVEIAHSSSNGETSHVSMTDSNEMTSSLNRKTISSDKNDEVESESRPQKRKASTISSVPAPTFGQGVSPMGTSLEARICAGQSVDISRLSMDEIAILGFNALLNIPLVSTWDILMREMHMNKEVINITEMIPEEEGKVFEWLVNVKHKHEDLINCFYEKLINQIDDLSKLSSLVTGQVTRIVRCIFMTLSLFDLPDKIKKARNFLLNILLTRSPEDMCQCLTFLLMKPPTASLALEILKTKIDDADDVGRFISMQISRNKDVDVLNWACSKFTAKRFNSLEGAAFKMPVSAEMVERWWESEIEIVEKAKDRAEAHSSDSDAASVLNNSCKDLVLRMSLLISPRFQIEGLDRIKLFDQLVSPVFDMIDGATKKVSIGRPMVLAMNEGRVVALKMHITMEIVKSCCSHQIDNSEEQDSLCDHVDSLLQRVRLILQRPTCTAIQKPSVPESGLRIAILSLARDWNVMTRAYIKQREIGPVRKRARISN